MWAESSFDSVPEQAIDILWNDRSSLDEIQLDNDRLNKVLIGHLTELGVNRSDIEHSESDHDRCPSPLNITEEGLDFIIYLQFVLID
jgi:hypothetical protein